MTTENNTTENNQAEFNIKLIDKKTYYKNYCIKHDTEFKKKVTCLECGGKYTKLNKFRHEHTKKHINCVLIKKLQNDFDEIKTQILTNQSH